VLSVLKLLNPRLRYFSFLRCAMPSRTIASSGSFASFSISSSSERENEGSLNKAARF